VATLAVTETTSYGVLAYAFGVFLLPMQQELGWSRTALTGAYSLAIIVSGVAAIPVGRWLDRHGARTLMTAGSAGATVLVLAWAHVTDLVAFYAIWTGIGLVMAAVLYEPAFAVIATWFRDAADRTRALLALTRGHRVRQRHLRPAGRVAGSDHGLARCPGGAGHPARPPHHRSQRHLAWPAAR
jgi:MFS family permease